MNIGFYFSFNIFPAGVGGINTQPPVRDADHNVQRTKREVLFACRIALRQTGQFFLLCEFKKRRLGLAVGADY